MKQVTIIINGTQVEVEKGELSFDEVVALAFENPPYGEYTEFSVTFSQAQGNKPEGILHPSESVKVKEGTIFDVTATDRS